MKGRLGNLEVGHPFNLQAKTKLALGSIFRTAALSLLVGCGNTRPYAFSLLDASPSGSPFSRVHFIANGPVEVTTDCSIFASYPHYAEVSMTINGQQGQIFNCTSALPQTFRASPVSGSSVEIVSGPRVGLPPDLLVVGNTIQKVAGNAWEAPEPIRPLVVVYGDSIASGFGTDVPTRDAWTVLLRQEFEVGVEAWGARQLHLDYVSGLDHLMSYFASYGTPGTIWLAIGVNDCFAGWDPVEFQKEYGALLDATHSKFQTAKIFAQTPLILADESNMHGYAPSAYREAISNACSARTFCRFVDGTAILPVADLSGDGVHPTTVGNIEYESYVLKAMN